MENCNKRRNPAELFIICSMV